MPQLAGSSGVLTIAATALAAAGVAYNLLSLWSALHFRKSVSAPAGFTPPVSILKPLRGADPAMYEAFRSHCLQDYPEYELIFGVHDPADPAAVLVKRLMGEFPERRIRLMACPEALGANMKVSSLIQMLPLARHDYLIVADSDIRVAPDYLRRVVAPLQDPKLGLVTCLYGGAPERTLGSRLEALGISTDFAPGVLAARYLQGLRFGLGSTLAFPRRALNAIGGFEVLADYLGDDYQLGERIANAGLEVRLSEVVVDHHLPAYSFPDFLAHQLRWARTVRDSRPAGYTGLALTFALPWAILALAFSKGAAWAWGLLAAALAVRFATALIIGSRLLRDAQIARSLWLIPLRDVVGLFVWIFGFAGHTISWRGDKFILEKGKLCPAGKVATPQSSVPLRPPPPLR